MPKFEYRFDIAAVLLATVLTVLGVSAAQAGGSPGGVVNLKHGAASSTASGHAAGGRHQGARAHGRATRGIARDAREGASPQPERYGGARGGVVDYGG